MKYLLALIGGLAVGALIFCIGLVYNPLIGEQSLSPLAVTDAQTVTLTYSPVPSESIVYTNNGETRAKPNPEKVLQLWEAPIRKTSALVAELRDGRGQVAGIGVKLSSASEQTHLYSGRALANSVWYIYLPGRGSLFIDQTENYWDYLRDIVLPAYRSASDTWAGSWLGNITTGPGSLGTSRVTGSSGEFADLEMLGVESLDVRAWKVNAGPVAAEGRLLIEIPDLPQTELAQSAD